MANPLQPVGKSIVGVTDTGGLAYSDGTTSDSGVATTQNIGDTALPQLGALRAALAPDPNRTYSDLLPVSQDTGATFPHGLHPAIPNALRSLLTGGIDLLEGPATGQVTPQATNTLLASAAPDLIATPEEGVLKTFGGINSKGADLGKLETAKQLEQNGELPETTWAQTGWEKNPVDGKWRYEIDDSRLQPTSNFIDAVQKFQNSPFQGKLGDLVQHDELFKAYPDMKNANLTVAPAGTIYPAGMMGGYGKAGNGHGESFFLAGDQSPYQMKRTLVHEMQHAIQAREGFEPGANSNTAKQSLQKAGELQQMLGTNTPGFVRSALYTYQNAPNDWSIYNGVSGEVEARNAQNRVGQDSQVLAATPPSVSQEMHPYVQLPVQKINQLYSQTKGNN
jgi:hypothetical protein